MDEEHGPRGFELDSQDDCHHEGKGQDDEDETKSQIDAALERAPSGGGGKPGRWGDGPFGLGRTLL